MIKLVVFDLDNVIIDGEAIDEIGKLANVEEEIAEITEKAMLGEIDFETAIKDRVKLLEGISIEDIQKVADELVFMTSAEEAINNLKNEDLDIAIISGSFDVVADVIKEKLGVDYIFTNSFIVEDGKLTGEVEGPLVSGTKLDVLKDLADEKGISLEEVVAVGDGANDISMIEAAGIGIAFNAKPSVKEIADIVVEGKDLNDVFEEINNQLTANIAEETAVEQEIEDEAEEAELEVAAEDVEVEVEEAEEVEEALDEVVPEEAAVEEAEKEAEEEAELEEASEDVEVEVEEAEEVEEALDEVVPEEAAVEEAEKEAEEEAELEEASEDVEEEVVEKAEKPKKDSTPKSDFVLADTIEGVRQQKDEKEAEISKIAEEREEFNNIAKEERKIRDQLNASLKENLNKAIEFRNERNDINKEVEKAKKARNDANNKLKNLEWSSGKRNKIKIENEIKKIDKIIETRVLDIKKENQLVKNANDLRKQLNDIQEDETVQSEAQELKKLSEEEHAKVIELSEKAQEAHEKMLEFFRKTDDIRTAADEAHKKFIEARKNASAKHEEFKVTLSDIHVINKKLGTSKPRKRKSDNKPSGPKGNKNNEEKERAEKIFEKFKNGGKLSTEELLLLQKYNRG